ncbi:hypothetical protein QQ045_006649 [Rhodiola kirilowii]
MLAVIRESTANVPYELKTASSGTVLSRSWSYAENGQMHCLFRGNIHNVNDLKRRYGLEASADVKCVIFEMYKSITSAEVSPDSVLKELTGEFAFVLYDAADKCIFVATDSEGRIPFFWGTSAHGPLIVASRDCSIRNFDHPTKKLKSVPFIYEETGEQLGVTFVIDEESEETSSSGSSKKAP